MHTIFFGCTGNHKIAGVRAKESYPALAEGLAEVIAEINSKRKEILMFSSLKQVILVQTRQNGYQTVPFGVYIHNLMFVFISDKVILTL